MKWNIYVRPKGSPDTIQGRLIATCYMYSAAVTIAECLRSQLQAYEPLILSSSNNQIDNI